jgi:hypothetical protein
VARPPPLPLSLPPRRCVAGIGRIARIVTGPLERPEYILEQLAGLLGAPLEFALHGRRSEMTELQQL